MPRPRKSGKRTKSGRLSRAYKHPELRDHGTTEAQAKRAAFINGAAVELAGSALGILLARKHISREQMDAGQRYGRLHAIIFGPAWRQACVLGDPTGGPVIEDEKLIRLREALDAMHSRLTPEQRQVVANVAVFNHLPIFFFAARLRLRMLDEDLAEHEGWMHWRDERTPS